MLSVLAVQVDSDDIVDNKKLGHRWQTVQNICKIAQVTP